MANTDAPRGLVPIRHRNGAPYNGPGSLYHVPASNSTTIGTGDPVTVTGTADSNGIPDVARSSAGGTNAITGAVIGRTNGIRNSTGEFTLLRDDNVALPASTEGYLLVADDPDVVFEIQSDGDVAATDISSNANLTSGAINTFGQSGFELDSTSFATTATHQLKVLRVVQRDGNSLDNSGTNAKLEVMINNHTQTAGTAGV